MYISLALFTLHNFSHITISIVVKVQLLWGLTSDIWSLEVREAYRT